MNKNLIQINNNLSAVTDEEGNVDIISKENDDYDFKEILERENEIEKLNENLNENKIDLRDLNEKIIYGRIATGSIIIIELIAFLIFNISLDLLSTIGIMGLGYLLYKGLSTVAFGTRIGRHFQKKKLIQKIEKLENDIPILEKELKEIKEKEKYKVNYSSIKKSNNNKVYTSEIRMDLNYEYTKEDEEDTKVKVMSLIKK